MTTMTNTTEKRAPVQGYPGGIPWAIHLEAYEVYCKRWSPQPALIDLEGRGCRGGFSTGELDDFIPGWRDRVAQFGLMKTALERLIALHDEPFNLAGKFGKEMDEEVEKRAAAVEQAIAQARVALAA